VTPLRRTALAALWAQPVKRVLTRVPLVRRLYSGWTRIHPFDAEYGVDTSGWVPATECAPTPAMAARMSPYGGSQPSIVRRCLAAIPDHDRYAFVDLGCGKGRPLVVASEFPFRRIVGVELSKTLADTAARNAAVVAAAHPQRTPIEITLGDATAIVPPHDRVVYYMYHPFDRSLVTALVANIASQLENGLRHAWFIYYNPVHGVVLDSSARFSRWDAETVPYASNELGYGPDLEDAFVIWQTTPPAYPPRPGARRPIVVDPSGSNAHVEH